MPEANLVPEHAEVLSSDGVHVGTVDHVDGDRIKLTKADSNKGDGEHHYIAKSLIADIRGNSVMLTVPAAEAISGEE
jgi:hypothetical protein